VRFLKAKTAESCLKTRRQSPNDLPGCGWREGWNARFRMYLR